MEKKIATHSIILAWEILWTEEPGEVYMYTHTHTHTHTHTYIYIQTLGSQRVGHNLAIQHTHPPLTNINHVQCLFHLNFAHSLPT